MDILNEEEQENLIEEIKKLEIELQELEINALLNDEYDSCNCYLEIHPGAI